ncbi:DUF3566 domain-containing protein [Blastococcus sp. CT_GayMR20]|uniref:DUF3566 domain-containing protein n=1 Tax=Blastococcus sp. CT_GayMR20 TaxID=2559609 RepID=UPI0010745FFD|nr:DUF3566 domain-containing protein [Blastococcus sp. CT_GayMR20]TFV87057.1 DUF3566 domain-containing protein [Blastococcus sp. CT_GayMR20]
MSDRTPSSVRTGARTGETAAQTDPTAGEPAPVSATQSIPTGSQPAHPVNTGPATVPPVGSVPVPPATGAAPAVPPMTGGAPAVPPAGGSFVSETSAAQAADAAAARGTSSSRGRGPAKASGRGPRRARLQLRHIDTWSALKISLVLSIALFFIWMVAVGVLYGVLSALGVFDTLNELFGQLGSASGGEVAGDVVTPGVVFGGAAVIGAINIVLLTALCTVGTFIYNLCSDLVGGLELTLSERD